MSAEPAPPFQTTLGGIPAPTYSWEAANKAYVDAHSQEGGLIHYSENDSIGASGRRSLQSWIYGGTIREAAGGVPSNTDFIAIANLSILSVKWTWRGTILSEQPQPYMAIYDTDAAAEILSTPVGVRDEVHSFSPTSPTVIEAGKAYSLQFNTNVQFPQNNLYRFTAEFTLAPPADFEKFKKIQDELLKDLVKEDWQLSKSIRQSFHRKPQQTEKPQSQKNRKKAKPNPHYFKDDHPGQII